MAVAGGLEDLVPLLGHWIELVHVVRAAVGVGPGEEVEETAVLDHSVACTRRVDDVIVYHEFLITCIQRALLLNLRRSRNIDPALPEVVLLHQCVVVVLLAQSLLNRSIHILVCLSLPALLVIDVLLRNDSFPLVQDNILIVLLVVEIRRIHVRVVVLIEVIVGVQVVI